MQHQAVKEAREKMDKSLKNFDEEIMHIRTGRASTGLVDNIEVEAYGQKMRLNELATTSVPEA
ncbi:MAG: ribosome recycling factor, partial [Desulfuromonadales bacterium]|nr:ribosome recycling factor [Desulfuromonadales bacterium]NIS41612.1 ribosome recycling factor [Desulfuromonadales bacterium]